MSRGANLKQALATVGGGAAAGWADGHFAGKEISGFGYGTIGSAALLALGLAGGGGRYSKIASELGAGGLAGKAYVFANKKGSPDGAVHGVRGTLPTAARVITPQQVDRIYQTIGL